MSLVLPTFAGFVQPAVAGEFSIDLRLAHATILARSGDDVGTVAYGIDTSDLYVYDGTVWYFYDYNLLPIANELALDFDGADDKMTLGDLSYLSSASAVTLSVWFKTSENDAYIFSSHATGASIGFYESFQVYFHHSDTLNLVVGTGSNYAQVATSSTSFNDGNWHHGAFVFDGGSPALKIYVDGTLQTVSATGTTVPSTLVADAGDGATVSSLAHGGLLYYLDSTIDEMAFFDKALTETEISGMYNCGVPNDISPLNPVSWWRGGDGVGDTDSGGGTPANGDAVGTVVDQVGGNDGTGVNALYSSNRPYGLSSITDNFSLSLGGSDEHMSIAASSDFEFGTGDFTMSVWFKADTINSNPASDYYSLIDLRGSLGDNAPTLYMSQQAGYRLYAYNGSSVVNYDTTPTTGQWYHVAYVREGTTGTIYLDGSSVASGTDNKDYDLSTPAPTIGKVATSATGQYFVGAVDEFSLFDSALQDVDISAIYNCGKPGDLDDLNPVGWWRMGEGATWDSTNWTIPDASDNDNAGTTGNMEEADRVRDLPS